MRAAAVLVLGMTSMATVAGAAGSKAAVDCEAIYQAVTDSTAFPTSQSKIRHLSEQGQGCRGTGLYESRLAYFYVESGKIDEAARVLNQGLSTRNDYHKQLKYSLADLDVTRGRLDQALRNATALKTEYPDWFGGYMLLAKITLMQRRFAESIQYGMEANKREPNSSVYLGLAIAHHQLDQDEQAVEAGLKAIEMDPLVVKSGAGVDETIYSLVRLNRPQDAIALAKARMKNDSAWRTDPVFVKAYEYLRQRAPGEFVGAAGR